MAKKVSVVVPVLDKVELQKLVDAIGFKLAELAPGLEQLEAMKDKLKTQGVGKYSGELYDITVFDQRNDHLNMDAVRAKLTPQFIRANTKKGTKRVLKSTAKQKAKAEQAAVTVEQVAA